MALINRLELKKPLFEDTNGKYHAAKDMCILDKNGIDLEETIEIYKLLNIKLPLLNKEGKEWYAGEYGFKKIADIDNRLFQLALNQSEYTSTCMKYLKEYDLDEFSPNKNYTLTVNQVLEFCENDNIISYINENTIEYLKGKKSVKFKLEDTYTNVQDDFAKIKEYCKNKDDILSQKLHDYSQSVAFYYSEHLVKDVYLTNSVFGSDIIKSMNYIFGRVNSKLKNFFSFVQLDEIEKKLEALYKDQTCNDNEFLNELIGIRNAQKKILGNQYKNIIKLINETGTKPQRFLSEILQNVDDCEYDEEPFVELSFYGNKLTVKYNERGFSRENIAAITAIGDSTKQALADSSTTGEKGIGFKSIFNIANKVEIYSNNFNFYLNREEPTIPKKIKSKSSVSGTKMIIEVKNGLIDNIFDKDNIVKLCLCLKKIKHLIFNGKELKIFDKEYTRTIDYGEKITYYKYIYSFEVKDERIRKERYEDVLADSNQKITYLVPKSIKPDDRYYIYSTFPTLKEVNVPVIIDANLKLNTSREDILDLNKWNKNIIKEIHNGFLLMLLKLRELDYKLIADVIPYDGYLLKNISANSGINIKQNLQGAPIYKVYNKNEFISLKEGFVARNIDRLIIDTWGYKNDGKTKDNFRNDCIDFNLQKITQLEFYDDMEFTDYCWELYKNYDVIHPENLQNDKFRNMLYDYLRENIAYGLYGEEIKLSKWEIIPVLRDGITSYIKYTENIYYLDENQESQNLPNSIYILDQEKMDKELFRHIYSSNKFKDISKYTEGVILDGFVEKIEDCLYGDKDDIANNLLELFNSDQNTFEQCINKRSKEFNKNSFYLKTRKELYLSIDECYMPADCEKDTVLDYVIVADEFIDLAKVIKVKPISQITDVSNIGWYFTEGNLNNLLDVKSISNNNWC